MSAWTVKLVMGLVKELVEAREEGADLDDGAAGGAEDGAEGDEGPEHQPAQRKGDCKDYLYRRLELSTLGYTCS